MSELQIPTTTFYGKIKVPLVGVGCWMDGPGGGERAEVMLQHALKLGYRHVDTAYGYLNEEHVGKAIRESGIPREEIFLTTKLGGLDHGRVKEALEASLQRLGLDYVDLYLMHWPQAEVKENGVERTLGLDEYPTFIDTWKQMEKLLETGKCKSIGISNFSIKNLERLLPHCTIIPATNQVELHPFLPQLDLVAYCKSKGITLTAYSPFGQGNPAFFPHEKLKAIAEKYNGTVAQVVVSWLVGRGIIVLAKSEKYERLKQNATLLPLTEEDFKVVESVHLEPGNSKSLMTYFNNGKVFGWTTEQLGWKYSNQ